MIRYNHLGEIIVELSTIIEPPERLGVAEAAERYRYVNNPGSYIGPWKNSTVPMMVEPMNTFSSYEYTGMIFVGPAQSGKALDVNTPILTSNGWKTMGEIQVGDVLYDESGSPTEVTFVTPFQYERQCFKVDFGFGTKAIVADADHQWKVDGLDKTLLTPELRKGHKISRKGKVARTFVVQSVSPVESRPVRCIQVSGESHLYLAGEDGIPTHNTDSLILNPVVYSVKVDPMDMMIVCPTMIAARDFSIRRIDRLHRHSEKVGEMLLPGSDNDNTFDKKYKTGMLLSLSWPTPTELAGKPIGRVVLTDRDRMEDDVGGDGEPFDLASKRTTTFGSYAMTVAESSPSREVDNLKWIRTTPHEAPPCKGILALYNRGDRRRWYWPCPKCENYFEGNFKMFEWDKTQGMSNLEAAETVRMVCPHCSHKIKFDDRDEMQRWGVWVKDGQSVDKTGRVYGPKPRTLIASFWLNGVAAAFVTWRRLVAMYLDAHDEYERTGSEEALKKFYNNDLGEPYYPKALNDLGRLPETLKARAENLPERQVPEGVRFLIGNVDVQKNSFVVQVFGICPGKPFDVVVIDRFVLRKSQRRDHDGDAEWLRPSAYVEDWHEIRKHVMEKTYELGDGSGRRMAIKFTTCDSGGEEGVTTKAYEFYRELRSENRHRRFILTKGDPHPSQPRTRISYPDASRRDSKSGARGDVPVLLFNSNLLKDALDGRLDCLSPGQGMFRFPDWLSDDWFSEMCSEIRGPKGWERPRGVRNEAWDLAYYCLGVCASELIRAEHIDWENPPSWAKPWDENDLVSSAGEKAAFAEDVESAYDFGQFGKALA